MAKLLFTGGTGYIGSHTVIEFQNAGYDIVIIDNLENSDLSVLDRIADITGKHPVFYQGDIRDRAILDTIFSDHDIDVVIHFAGLKAVGESCDYPGLYHDNNIHGSMNLFEVMESHGVRDIVFSSSATVYASTNPLPWREDALLGTTNPYGTTKLIIEYLLGDYATHCGWHVANLRYFNPIGAHSSGLIGENPRGIPNNLLPYVMQVVSGERDYVRVYGNDYDTPDGTGVRDYIHVMDLATGHLAAYRYLSGHQEGGYIESFNLGTGKGTSVLEIIQITSELIGRDVPYQIESRRAGDIAAVYCNPTRALEVLGWQPRYTVREATRDSLYFAHSI